MMEDGWLCHGTIDNESSLISAFARREAEPKSNRMAGGVEQPHTG